MHLARFSRSASCFVLREATRFHEWAATREASWAAGSWGEPDAWSCLNGCERG